MRGEHLADLPDDEYRAYWLAFHEQVDWSKRPDVTRVPITSSGPDALYRRNKGSFMERLQPEIHCRPFAAHARRAKRTGMWVSEDAVFELAHAPALDFTAHGRVPVDVPRLLRKCLRLPAVAWPARVSLKR